MAELVVPHPAPHAVAGLEHDHRFPRLGQATGRGEAGKPTAHDHDVGGPAGATRGAVALALRLRRVGAEQ